MKICNVTMHYYPIIGGQEVYINNLNKILLKNNSQVSVLQKYVKHKTEASKDTYFTNRALRYLQILLHPLISNAGWFVFNLGLLFSRKVLQQQDLLICHYPFHYPPISWHKKIIIVSHGVLWSDKPKTLFDVYHKKISLSLKNRKVFIVANDTHFLREMGYKIEPNKGFFSEVEKDIWFIPNCVNTKLFTKIEEIKKEKIILVPRNIRYDRGIHLAIEAFRIFTKNNHDYKLVIIGSGKGKYYNYCRKNVSNYNLNERVIFISHANHEEMVEYYNKASITLIPSIEKEGTSLSALESMSCGTATIVTPVAGLLDLPAFKTELDINKISKDLEYVINHNLEISANQQKVVRENFNIELWEKSWLKVISDIKNR